MALPKPPYISPNWQKTYDTELEIHVPGTTVATNGVACHIAGTAASLDLGGGFTEGYFVVNVTDLPEPVAGCWFNIELQGALDSAFASNVVLQNVVVGDAGLPNTSMTEDQLTGVYAKPFSNMYGDAIMRYVRGYVRGGGTLSTGITFDAFLAK